MSTIIRVIMENKYIDGVDVGNVKHLIPITDSRSLITNTIYLCLYKCISMSQRHSNNKSIEMDCPSTEHIQIKISK